MEAQSRSPSALDDSYNGDIMETLPNSVSGLKSNGLDIVIQRNRGVYFKAKVINLDDS